MGDYASWSAVYNALSFGIAGMGSATIFFWLEISNVNKKYRTALAITGLVTAIATYHYFRIFNSWNDAFNVKFEGHENQEFLTGQPFNDAYRYVDWVLTVPLLLIELILVMGLPAEETVEKKLESGYRLGDHGGSWLSWRDPGQSGGPLDVVVLCHDSIPVRCAAARRRFECSY